MSPEALMPELQALRRLFRLARKCERQANDYDQAWHDYQIAEAAKIRENARWYYERWKWSRDLHRPRKAKLREAA